MQTELWVWEPKTKGLDNRWVSPASWMDSGRQRGGGTWEEETLAWLDCEEIKAQGFLWDLSSEKPARAVSVFMEWDIWGSALGKLGWSWWGNLTVWVGTPEGTCQVTGATTGKGLWSQQWKFVIFGSVAVRVLWMVTLGSFLYRISQRLYNLQPFSKMCSYIKIWTVCVKWLTLNSLACGCLCGTEPLLNHSNTVIIGHSVKT